MRSLWGKGPGAAFISRALLGLTVTTMLLSTSSEALAAPWKTGGMPPGRLKQGGIPAGAAGHANVGAGAHHKRQGSAPVGGAGIAMPPAAGARPLLPAATRPAPAALPVVASGVTSTSTTAGMPPGQPASGIPGAPSSAGQFAAAAPNSGFGPGPGAGIAAPRGSLPGVSSRPSLLPRPPAGSRLAHVPIAVAVSPLAALLPGILPLLAVLMLLALALFVDGTRDRRRLELAAVLAAQLKVPPRALGRLSPAVLERLEEQVAFDDLTGVMRRGPGLQAVERELDRARRLGTKLTLAFLDVDALKLVNDSDGHRAGDQLLQRVTDALKRRLRGQDLIFRYGGDEFVCLLPETTPEGAGSLLNSIRKSLLAAGSHSFTFGLAEPQSDKDDAAHLIARADAALYRHKARQD